MAVPVEMPAERLRRRTRAGTVPGLAGALIVLGPALLWSEAAGARDQRDYCNEYANNAVISATENRNYGCGGWGTRYSFDYQRHFGWCMSVPRAAAERERLLRKRFVSACTGRR